MMNEVEKKTVAEVANRLALMAEELRSGKFMSVTDVANVIDCRVRHLRNALDYAATAAQPAATPTTDAERLKRYHTVRYTGIEFKRYFSPHFVRLVGSFVNPAGDKNQNHVYELLVKESASRPGRWIAKGTNDGRELFTLTCASKGGAERYGFGALRSYLLRHLRKTIKANKAKEGK